MSSSDLLNLGTFLLGLFGAYCFYAAILEFGTSKPSEIERARAHINEMEDELGMPRSIF